MPTPTKIFASDYEWPAPMIKITHEEMREAVKTFEEIEKRVEAKLGKQKPWSEVFEASASANFNDGLIAGLSIGILVGVVIAAIYFIPN